MKTALLIMVHGSPRVESNLDVYAVVEVLHQRGNYPIIEVGFLECNEPSIPAAIELCVRRGARRIVAVPYFLHAGNHVANDLPALLEQAQARYSEIEFLMGDYIGHEPILADILFDRARQA